jgi:hypothetical protein
MKHRFEHGIALAFILFGVSGNLEWGSPLLAMLGVFMIFTFGVLINPFKKRRWVFYLAGCILGILSSGFPYSIVTFAIFNTFAFMFWSMQWGLPR